MGLRKIVGYVAINAAVLVGGYLSILFLAALAQDAWRVTAGTWFEEEDKRVVSPAYDDRAYARRVLADQKAADYTYVPFVGWRQKPVATPTLNVGPDGNRRHTVGTDNRPGAPTLGMFGGSTMWGTGVDDNGTIAALFDSFADDYVVVNYGERGHTSRQNLAQLANLINTGQTPDIAVFYSGYNDVWTHCNYAVTESLNGHMEERKIRSTLDERRDDAITYRQFLLPAVKAVRRLAGEGGAKAGYACANDPQRAEAVAEMMVATWEMARQLMLARGRELHVFLQPCAYLGRPNIAYLDVGGRRAGRREQFEAVYPLIKRKLAERGLDWVVDLTGAFDGDRALYIDDAHVAVPGNMIIAREIYARIAPAAR